MPKLLLGGLGEFLYDELIAIFWIHLSYYIWVIVHVTCSSMKKRESNKESRTKRIELVEWH